jgi:phosphatidylserine/phosphatidylglycerophosphate/cardiolipin synthase-like enzyme
MSNDSDKSRPDDFFLSGGEETSEDITALTPLRRDTLIEPLVDGIAAFKSMEEAIFNAKQSVYLAFWIFNPRTGVQSSAVKRADVNVRKWKDLIRNVAARGVTVRVLLTDFDPLFQDGLHRNNWGAYRTLVDEARRLGEAKRDLLQIICSLHLATASVGLGTRLESKLKEHVGSLNKRLKKEGEATTFNLLSNWPGLWNLVEYEKKTRTFLVRNGASLVVHPASHHQKLCIVDETTAYCGGLDVNTGRIATPAHDREAYFWHDMHVKIQGTAAYDICRQFIARWNGEAALHRQAVVEMNSSTLPVKMATHAALSDLAPKVAELTITGKTLVQIHCTRSENALLSPIPSTTQDDVKQGYEQAIKQARQFIYIENQYVRSRELGEWLIASAKARPAVRIIIVVPVAPEEVGATGKGDEITEHGLFMQNSVFTDLRRELEKRIGIFSLIMKVRGLGRSKTETFGSPQIYVHSKILIVDDLYANIGSPNANPRSFYVDTELSAAMYDPNEVKELRLRLWAEHLGNVKGMASWSPTDFVVAWTKIAESNAKAPATSRQGFVIPHDTTRFPGTQASEQLDKFAGIFDLEREVADSAVV